MKSLIDRLADKFLVGDGCWQWTAATRRGYGVIASEGGRSGRLLPAHRVVYELLVGPIPDGFVLDHLCRNRTCVRPDHLEPVPFAENLRRGTHHYGHRTHCKNGHPFEGDNVRMRTDGGRACRICAANYARAYGTRAKNDIV